MFRRNKGEFSGAGGGRGARDYRVSHGNETVRRESRKSLARDLSSFIRPCQRSDAYGKLCQKYRPLRLPTYLSTHLAIPTYSRACILSGCLHRYTAVVIVLEMVAIFARSWQEDNETRPDTRYTTTLSRFSLVSLLLSFPSVLYHPQSTLQSLCCLSRYTTFVLDVSNWRIKSVSDDDSKLHKLIPRPFRD